MKAKGVDVDLRVSCVQMVSVPGQLSRNLDQAEVWVKRAADQGAELVVLPELVERAYDLEGRLPSDADHTGAIDRFCALSRSTGTTIVAGLWEAEGGRNYDSQLVFQNGLLVCVYRKMHLFGPGGEPKVFHPGDTPVTFTVGGSRWGLGICFDLRFPELFRYYHQAGCHGVVISSAFPAKRVDHWLNLTTARAIENQFFVLAANRAGTDLGLRFCGFSRIVDPWGTELAGGDEGFEGPVSAMLSLSNLEAIRATIPCDPHPYFSKH